MNLSGLPLRELRDMTAARERQMQALRAERLEIAQEIERRVERGEEEPPEKRHWWSRGPRPAAPTPTRQAVSPGFVEDESQAIPPGD